MTASFYTKNDNFYIALLLGGISVLRYLWSQKKFVGRLFERTATHSFLIRILRALFFNKTYASRTYRANSVS